MPVFTLWSRPAVQDLRQYTAPSGLVSRFTIVSSTPIKRLKHHRLPDDTKSRSLLIFSHLIWIILHRSCVRVLSGSDMKTRSISLRSIRSPRSSLVCVWLLMRFNQRCWADRVPRRNNHSCCLLPQSI
jgi:hypothetical protein